MLPCLLSSRSLHPITSRHLSPAAAAAPPSPLPLALASLRPSPPSLTCALQCPHFESCSGCTHELNLHRPSVVDDAVDFFKSLGVSDFTFDSCKLWGWRCRAKFVVRGSSVDPLIGVYQEGTHSVVDIPDCKAHHPNINAAMELLKQGIIELGIESHDEDQGTGDLRYVQRCYLFGHLQAFDSLLRKLQKYVPYGASVTDLYAGSGVIGLSLAATRKCRSVKCVEINKESKLSFEKIVERLPTYVDSSISWYQADTSVEPTSWLVGSDVTVVDPPRKGLEASLVGALQTLPSRELKTRSSPESSKTKEEKRPWVLRAREAFVRFGNDLSEESRHSAPHTLIYISCGWESFKEDCKSLLSSKAWHLEKAHGFNFFPGTQSIEVLAVFKRRENMHIKKKKAGKKRRNQLRWSKGH
ncbi:uncharacterized protein LOC115693975 [Syzygium oleosum]|uniref:uncharacterized protein LOC115693975 n=1 Tax=Syzygium oleosum TaxID=219896 RepID=UPI0024B8A91C|nr:uncharacterized protein LOC115693975 [Syzygium oleosum]